MKRVRFVASGMYVPKNKYTNKDLEKLLNENIDEFVSTKIGIKERYFSDPNETSATMAVEAAKEALKKANWKPEDIDLIIVSTDTPEYISPSTAAKVQYLLNAKNAGFFDINSACSGFVIGLDIASKHIILDQNINKVLLIGTYNMSKFIDWKDKKTASIFADGAGAFLLEGIEANGHLGRLATKYYGNGEFHDYMGIYAGGTLYPVTKEILDDPNSIYKVRFLKKFGPEHNIQHWPRLVDKALEESKLTKYDVKHYIFTQINLFATKKVMDELGEPFEKTTTIMDKYGYTGSACIPMAFNEYLNKNSLNQDDVIVFCASGGGLSMCIYVYKH